MWPLSTKEFWCRESCKIVETVEEIKNDENTEEELKATGNFDLDLDRVKAEMSDEGKILIFKF